MGPRELSPGNWVRGNQVIPDEDSKFGIRPELGDISIVISLMNVVFNV